MRQARSDLRSMMAELPALRAPAIRRSDESGWMLATDLPGLTSEEALNVFCQTLSSHGWQYLRRGDWLLLDNLALLPTVGRPDALTAEGETGAVISLLERHPGSLSDDLLLRLIAKRAEEGTASLETFCSGLHRDLARRLRDHTDLPAGLLPYLYAAIETVKGEKQP